MKQRTWKRVLLFLALPALLLLGAGLKPIVSGSTETAPYAAVSTNQHFIEGLYAEVDIEDPDQVFRRVFSSLGDRVVVYPTENYYYFSLNAAGETLWGNLRLDANDRDEGILHLGYFRYNENAQFPDKRGFGKAYSADDGVELSRLDDFLYSVAYGGKTVLFQLNDIGFTEPRKARLREQEKFVGPIFDESGLRFFLLFDQETNHFFYVLNEDVPVPEELIPQGDNVVVGKRSGFAFYLDEKYGRKVLVAIHGKSMERNNYYDGPFDQLPDNYVSQTGIREYIEKAYPYTRGKINKFGGFLHRRDARVAIMPYHVYFKQEDLSFLDSCASSDYTEAEFYFCITPDFKQLGSRQSGLAALGGVTFSGEVMEEPAPEPSPTSEAAANAGAS